MSCPIAEGQQKESEPKSHVRPWPQSEGSDAAGDVTDVSEPPSSFDSSFLRCLSHELRTPLSVVVASGELLQDDAAEPLSETQRKNLHRIQRSAEHMTRIIDDMLTLSSVEEGRILLSSRPVKVLSVVEEVVSLLELAAEEADIGLEVAPGALANLEIEADPTRFAQILMNFCSNAIKYNRPGGSVTLSISIPRRGYIRVRASDTGLGIPVNQEHRLFQPFQRFGRDAAGISGSGIGLAISKHLAEQMGGAVGFDRLAPSGSEFWVDMPARRSAERAVGRDLDP